MLSSSDSYTSTKVNNFSHLLKIFILAIIIYFVYVKILRNN